MSATRITSSMTTRSVLSDLNRIAAQQDLTRRQMSSGKAITKPSDDPYGAARAMSLRTDLAGVKQHQRNVDEAQSWMSATSTTLSSITDLAQKARELTVQGATDTLPQSGRDAIADQIDQLIAGMKQEGNATYDGRYVLGGSRTNTPPYDATLTKTDPSVTTNDAYSGDAASQLRESGPGVTLAVNVHGDEVLGGASGSSGNLLGVLRDIATHLRSGDTAALGGGDIKAVSDQIDNLLAVQARVGAGMNRLDTASSRLAQIEESTTSMLSNTEDADMAEVITNYSTQHAVYQSALNAGARIVQTSLLDFLH
jgi:flagellar hook-associated protein 3 FlgL